MARTVAYASFWLILANVCLPLIPVPCGAELATGLQLFSVIFSSIKNPSSWGKYVICMVVAYFKQLLLNPVASSKSELWKKVCSPPRPAPPSDMGHFWNRVHTFELNMFFLNAKSWFCWANHPGSMSSGEVEIHVLLSGVFNSATLWAVAGWVIWESCVLHLNLYVRWHTVSSGQGKGLRAGDKQHFWGTKRNRGTQLCKEHWRPFSFSRSC